ncbi:hypothetical protein C0995_006832 [Termitomyces sp. Mi166|nr:hypothetical protein C0995_006832 [Termitomyces sp. Mi166\
MPEYLSTAPYDHDDVLHAIRKDDHASTSVVQATHLSKESLKAPNRPRKELEKGEEDAGARISFAGPVQGDLRKLGATAISLKRMPSNSSLPVYPPPPPPPP